MRSTVHLSWSRFQVAAPIGISTTKLASIGSFMITSRTSNSISCIDVTKWSNRSLDSRRMAMSRWGIATWSVQPSFRSNLTLLCQWENAQKVRHRLYPPTHSRGLRKVLSLEQIVVPIRRSLGFSPLLNKFLENRISLTLLDIIEILASKPGPGVTYCLSIRVDPLEKWWLATHEGVHKYWNSKPWHSVFSASSSSVKEA